MYLRNSRHGTAFGFAPCSISLGAELSNPFARQVIAIDMQGHGRTADINRPFTFEQMADDTAALLKHLKIEQADVFGYSMGGTIGLALAIRDPSLIRRLARNAQPDPDDVFQTNVVAVLSPAFDKPRQDASSNQGVSKYSEIGLKRAHARLPRRPKP